MKRKLFIVLFFLGNFFAGAQSPHMLSKFEERFALPLQDKPIHTKQLNSLIQVYDSIYYWNWNTTTIAWNINPYKKIINIVYDANNNLLNQTIQNWNGSTWVNAYQYIYTYDANNNQTSDLTQNWNGGSWK